MVYKISDFIWTRELVRKMLDMEDMKVRDVIDLHVKWIAEWLRTGVISAQAADLMMETTIKIIFSVDAERIKKEKGVTA